MIKNAIYSISEFTKSDIKNFRIVANPGCYPTSIQIPLVPLIINNLIKLDDITMIPNQDFLVLEKILKKNSLIKIYTNQHTLMALKNIDIYAKLIKSFQKLLIKKLTFTFNPFTSNI